MAVEIEAKMKVDDLDAIRLRLRDAGGRHHGAVLETNTFFDDAARSLVGSDKGLRLRRTRDLNTGERHGIITVKGPLQNGQLKRREEGEFEVSDAERAQDVLRMLGYTPTLTFEKRRESWTLGGCKVELDELPHLGQFVEIEGPDEATVMRVRESLRLESEPLIRTGYISMLSSFLKERNDARTSVTF
ncbi:MAG TPA: class IV adenylate cyclase [Tepidisphaeraceae bacterium]|nr:class IV adenylate cyclase [Tepidisphaeraceae bacterium]